MRNELNVTNINIEGTNPKMFKSFFEIDSDFGENVDYFRPDTIELGYENEAERCSEELYEKYFSEAPDGHMETLGIALEEGANFVSNNGYLTQFLLGNSTHVTDYKISIICTNSHDNEYVVVISYLSH